MEHSAPSRAPSFLVWLNRLPDWQFTVTLYLLRWAIVLPLGLLLSPHAASADKFHASGNPLSYLLPFLVVAPTLETFFECMLPCWVMYGLLRLQRHRVWPFVFVSAMAMVFLHPLTTNVIVFAFITGSFLAYVYAHFVPQSHLKAFLHTAGFHAAINVVGWTMMSIGSIG